MEKTSNLLKELEDNLKRDIKTDIFEKFENNLSSMHNLMNQINEKNPIILKNYNKILGTNFENDLNDLKNRIASNFSDNIPKSVNIQFRTPKDILKRIIKPKLEKVISELADDNIWGISAYNEIVNDFKLRIQSKLAEELETSLSGGKIEISQVDQDIVKNEINLDLKSIEPNINVLKNQLNNIKKFLESNKVINEVILPKLNDFCKKINADFSNLRENIINNNQEMSSNSMDIINQINNEFESLRGIEKENTHLNEELERIKTELESSKEHLKEDSETKEKKIQKLENELQENKKEIERLQKELETKNESLDKLNVNLEDLQEEKNSKIKSLEENLVNANQELEKLQAELVSKENRISEMERNKIQLIEQKNELEKEVKSLNSKYESLQNKLNESSNISEVKENKIQELQNLNQTLTNEKETLNNQISELQNQINSLNNEMKLKNDQIEQTNTEINLKTQQLEEFKTSKGDLERIKADITKEKEELQSENTNLNNQVVELKKQVEELNSKIETKDTKIENLRGEHTTLEQKTNELETTVSELKAKTSDLKNKNEELKQDLETKNTIITELEPLKDQAKRTEQLEGEIKELLQFIENSPKYQLLYLINNLGETSFEKLMDLFKFNEAITKTILDEFSEKGFIEISGDKENPTISIKQKLNPLSYLELKSVYDHETIKKLENYTDETDFTENFRNVVDLVDQLIENNQEKAGYLVSVLYLYIYESKNFHLLKKIRPYLEKLNPNSFYVRLVNNLFVKKPWKSEIIAQKNAIIDISKINVFSEKLDPIESDNENYPQNGPFIVEEFQPLSIFGWEDKIVMKESALNEFKTISDLLKWVHLNGKDYSTFEISLRNSVGKKYSIISSMNDKITTDTIINEFELKVD
ncbi:MAG: hypothetical protein EU549_00265 [Promethearchaeota archaeon]|nr:MAG: hypothetical protein EU549_00265 [Candidatus Lokiarchaeota archaeon]